ncbi:MAG: CvpA family protein [Deltaproteobacteria bacterium]|nr:CvpA family protein [Deltaproteobacteria bacterium]OQY11076.1 MAG: colicin V production protein [Desulfobacteraceae bacterium 4572_187]MBW1957131.1 CvpA family protein [Deltaproteobacteria bacterium]MBW2012522.1 CvpA family protein [Deltaproteobacteria bacterium]MBW2087826.1 CvpA family protein [Deltaproteobacteria bacterium]
MNFFDIIVIVILGYCLIRGVFRGLIKELSSIIGVLGGFYAAFTYYPLVAKPLSKWIANTGYLNILSFLIIFCGVFIIISILGVIINYLLKIAFLSWLDRILGSVFGAMKGVLIVSVLFIALTAFLPKGTPVIKDSLLSPYVTLVSEKIAKVVSKDMKHAFSAKIATIKKAWKKNK